MSTIAPIPHKEWSTMVTAPRDGSAFLVRRMSYAGAELCMRRVQWVEDGQHIVLRDLGAWVLVGGMEEPEIDTPIPTSASPEWSIAPDDCNPVSEWLWAPLPNNLGEIVAPIHPETGED